MKTEPPKPAPISLERRTTHRYSRAFSYLDDHEFVGTATIVASKRKGDSEGWREILVLKVEKEDFIPDSDVLAALGDSFNHGCACEHDCCGHVQTRAGRRRILSGGRAAVVVHSHRNL